MNNLTRFEQNGIELLIDMSTGESFATQTGYAKIAKVTQQAINKRLNKVTTKCRLKCAKLQSEQGLQGYNLITEDLIIEWLPKDNPELATQLLKLGVRMFLHNLAGFQFEKEQQPKLPATYIEALKALIQAEEEKEQLKLLNESLEEDNNRQAEIIDELFDYSSIIRIAKYNNCSETLFSWRTLKIASQKLNLEIKTAPCPRFGKKNLYHHQAWRLAYANYRVPETTTLVINR